jgi:hypothetical protein
MPTLMVDMGRMLQLPNSLLPHRAVHESYCRVDVQFPSRMVPTLPDVRNVSFRWRW